MVTSPLSTRVQSAITVPTAASQARPGTNERCMRTVTVELSSLAYCASKPSRVGGPLTSTCAFIFCTSPAALSAMSCSSQRSSTTCTCRGTPVAQRLPRLRLCPLFGQSSRHRHRHHHHRARPHRSLQGPTLSPALLLLLLCPLLLQVTAVRAQQAMLQLPAVAAGRTPSSRSSRRTLSWVPCPLDDPASPVPTAPGSASQTVPCRFT